MLGISQNTPIVDMEDFESVKMIGRSKTSRVILGSFTLILLFFLIFIFLPWTQNIRARGYVTSLNPANRPQELHSVIPGKIEDWYVREGDLVMKGDTLLKIGEIKNDYFDPNLLVRTQEQITAKEQAIEAYGLKVEALDQQIQALINTRNQKTQQAQNYVRQAEFKISADSMSLSAAQINYTVAQTRLARNEQLYKEGLKSLTDLESKRLKVQETNAKLIASENKLLTSRSKLINARTELISVLNQYESKLSKARSDRSSAQSTKANAEGDRAAKRNQLSNYTIRRNNYYLLAPQTGYITRALITGLGEVVKEGQAIVSIMPADYDLAVEMYIAPMDLPLIDKNQKVRFIFDGWPSVVLSGWPNASHGTFGGQVVAIDNFISENGKYRILVEQDPEEQAWPHGLRVGSGANGMALLKDVPIWYELWRNLNGFPPDYYKVEGSYSSKNKKKDKKKK